MFNSWTIDDDLDIKEKERIKTVIDEKLKLCIDNEQKNSRTKELANLMICKDKNLFLWSPVDEIIYCFTFKDDRKVTALQSFALTNSPIFEVRSLILSENGRYLAITGTRGINIAELPQKWISTNVQKTGRIETFCRCWSLDERFFVCNQKILLLETRWHPGDDEEKHIVILTNDNCLRIYNIDSPTSSYQQIYLSNSSEMKHNFSLFASSLGESAVSFDFGLPVSKNISNYEKNNYEIDTKDALWPIYLLKGNGDLMLVYSNIRNEYISKRVLGPLTMLPPAEDNYEMDAAKLICLDTLPLVIVIASSSGIIYNCIVLQNQEEIELDKYHQLLIQPTVFVYECIELTMSLTSEHLKQDNNNYTNNNKENGSSIHNLNDGNDLINSIQLYKDPVKSDRYFVSHLNGVHAVNLALINQIQSDTHSFEDFDKSLIEHIICTKPINIDCKHNNELKPIGLTVSLFKGQSHLRILLSSGDTFVQRLSLASKPCNIYVKNQDENKDTNISKSLNDQKVEFSDYINEILKRERSAPLLRSTENDNQINKKVMAEKQLELLLNSTTIFRQEYLSRMSLAMNIIDRRIKNLSNEKIIQLNERKRLSEDRSKLYEKFDQLTIKYDETLEKQSVLTTRLEKLLDYIHNQQIDLSDAERDAFKRMKEMKLNINNFLNKLEKIKLKNKYQLEIEKGNANNQDMNNIIMNRNTKNSPSYIRQPSNHQLKNIKDILEQEGEAIMNLLNQVVEIKKCINNSI